METQAVRGGPHVPWERDELWAPFISTQLSWQWGRGGKERDGPFPFKDLALHRHPCERCLRPRHQGSKNPGPSPSSLRPRRPGPQSFLLIHTPDPSHEFITQFQEGGEYTKLMRWLSNWPEVGANV